MTLASAALGIRGRIDALRGRSGELYPVEHKRGQPRRGRSADAFEVTEREGERTRIGAREVSDIVVHGHAQITTQALRLCAAEEIAVHFVGAGGVHIGVFSGGSSGVQRRIRQFRGLTDDTFAIGLAWRLVMAKIEMQLRHVLRASSKDDSLGAAIEEPIDILRGSLRRGADRLSLMGQEGNAARGYFSALAVLVHPDAGDALRPRGRSRRPPEDRFNALLSFGYTLLYRDVLGAILRVELGPGFGVLHQPRSAAFPLALDLTELFRVPVVDMAVLGAVNRRTFDAERDFAITGRQVWLSDVGRRAFIEVYERRKHEEYRHDVLGFSLSYARMMELEVRLMEKEWSGEPGLLAAFESGRGPHARAPLLVPRRVRRLRAEGAAQGAQGAERLGKARSVLGLPRARNGSRARAPALRADRARRLGRPPDVHPTLPGLRHQGYRSGQRSCAARP
nr:MULTISPECIES: type I-MYXAN CRISPR-associated endonuclease Cas1 [Sorangium]